MSKKEQVKNKIDDCMWHFSSNGIKDIKNFIKKEIKEIIKGVVGEAEKEIEKEEKDFGKAISLAFKQAIIDGKNQKRQEIINWFKDNGYEDELRELNNKQI